MKIQNSWFKSIICGSLRFPLLLLQKISTGFQNLKTLDSTPIIDFQKYCSGFENRNSLIQGHNLWFFQIPFAFAWKNINRVPKSKNPWLNPDHLFSKILIRIWKSKPLDSRAYFVVLSDSLCFWLKKYQQGSKI